MELVDVVVEIDELVEDRDVEVAVPLVLLMLVLLVVLVALLEVEVVDVVDVQVWVAVVLVVDVSVLDVVDIVELLDVNEVDDSVAQQILTNKLQPALALPVSSQLQLLAMILCWWMSS